MRSRHRWFQGEKRCATGMSVLELLIAVMMMVTFFSVFVVVNEYLSSFFVDANNGGGSDKNGSVSIQEAQVSLHMFLDELADYLSQPGIDNADIIRHTGMINCTNDPVLQWKLLIKTATERPRGYQYCLFSTSMRERYLADLTVEATDNTQPTTGIYVLYAIGDTTNLAAGRARRLFCRPKPFC